MRPAAPSQCKSRSGTIVRVTKTNWAAHAVILPGTGSDARFVTDAFALALAELGTDIEAVDPDPNAVVESYEAALSAAARVHGRIIVGGVSIGAAVAASWALRNRESVFGLLAALPPWIGDAGDSPAAMSARFTSLQLTTKGLIAVTAEMEASSPAWLAKTLRRSWASQWPSLPAALDEAAAYTAPTREELRGLTVPTAIVGAVDDPIHPFGVAESWHADISGSRLSAVALDEIGKDPGILGARAVADLKAALD